MKNNKIDDLILEITMDLADDFYDYVSNVKTIIAMADDPKEYEDFVEEIDCYKKIMENIFKLARE